MNISQKQPETKEERIAAWRENIPNLFSGSYRKQYDKAINRESMRAAINSKCLDCMCWQQAEVKRCDIITCPLHPYRPYQDDVDKPISLDSAQQRGRGEASDEKTPELHTTGRGNGAKKEI